MVNRLIAWGLKCDGLEVCSVLMQWMYDNKGR
jgi:hypothetical protein